MVETEYSRKINYLFKYKNLNNFKFWHKMPMKIKNKKKLTSYALQKVTNSVVKWTGILTSLCLDKTK